MKAVGIIFIIAIVVGAGYFTWWAIQRTLADDGAKNRRARRAGRRG